MMPPRCEICDKEFDEGGGLLVFRKTEEDKEYDRRAEGEPGFVGHPPYAAWFCPAHYGEAKKLTHLTLAEATDVLRKRFAPGK